MSIWSKYVKNMLLDKTVAKFLILKEIYSKKNLQKICWVVADFFQKNIFVCYPENESKTQKENKNYRKYKTLLFKKK